MPNTSFPLHSFKYAESVTRQKVQSEKCPAYFPDRGYLVMQHHTQGGPRRRRHFQYVSSLPICCVGYSQFVERWDLKSKPEWEDNKRTHSHYLQEVHMVMDAVLAVYLVSRSFDGLLDPLLAHIKNRVCMERNLQGVPYPTVRYLRPKQGPRCTEFVIGAWYYTMNMNLDRTNKVVLVFIASVLKDNTKKPQAAIHQILELTSGFSVGPLDPEYGKKVLECTSRYNCYIHTRKETGLETNAGTRYSRCSCCQEYDPLEHEYILIGSPGQYVTVCALNRVQAGSACWN